MFRRERSSLRNEQDHRGRLTCPRQKTGALGVDADICVKVVPEPRPDQLTRHGVEALTRRGLTHPAQDISLTTAVFVRAAVLASLAEREQEAAKCNRHIR
jgi:hypothetical protein